MLFKYNNKIHSTLLLVSVFFLIMGLGLNGRFKKPKVELNNEDKIRIYTPEFYEIVSLGNKKMLADLLWIYTLIQSDIEHQEEGKETQLYWRFESITNLDPYFKFAYQYGGIYLSTIKDDEIGAAKIYEKGLKYYGDNFSLNFFAAFHYLFEMGNRDRALELFEGIKNHPRAPSFIHSMIAKIKAAQGNLVDAYNLTLATYLQIKHNPDLKKHYEKTLYALKAEIDLKCLNKGLQNCKKLDFEKNPYIKKDGKWIAQKQWKKARLNIKNN